MIYGAANSLKAIIERHGVQATIVPVEHHAIGQCIVPKNFGEVQTFGVKVGSVVITRSNEVSSRFSTSEWNDLPAGLRFSIKNIESDPED